MRHDLYVHLQGMPLAFFTTRHTGELTTRLVLDTSRLASLSSDMLVSTLRRVGTIVALLVVMFTRDWALTLLVATMLPVAALVNWPLGRQLYKINRRAQEMSGQLAVLLMESLTGRKIVKAFVREDLEQARFDRLNDRRLRLALRDHRVDEFSRPLLEIVAALGIVGAIWYGGSRVIQGTLTPGSGSTRSSTRRPPSSTPPARAASAASRIGSSSRASAFAIPAPRSGPSATSRSPSARASWSRSWECRAPGSPRSWSSCRGSTTSRRDA